VLDVVVTEAKDVGFENPTVALKEAGVRTAAFRSY
jgi:hypothetical protein